MSRFHYQFYIKIAFFLLLFPVLGVFAGAKPESAGLSNHSEAGRDSTSTEQTAEIPPFQQQPDRAEMVMKAFAAAYPDRLGPAEKRDGDWAILLGGVWYYYAEGRLLPEELRGEAANYTGQPFYTYAAELPPWKPPSAEESERMRLMTENRQRQERSSIRRSQFFYEALWRIHNRDESWDRVKQIRFLGFPVMIHYSILSELSLVEERILKEAKINPEVRQWINSLNTVEGWSWRNIAASQSRSFHAYGAAIDLLPRSTGGLATYWQWTAQTNPEWWTVPYSQRYQPPPGVIKAFESFGFVWGGKWTVYDTMHFEYRPEILVYSNIPLVDHRMIMDPDF